MISYGDMLDTLEKNEPQNPPTVVEKKGGDNVTEKKGYDEPENKYGEPEKDSPDVDESEDVI